MLTDTAIRKAKPRERRYMLSDGDGLYLEIMTSGKKYWRLRYWVDKKEYKQSLGQYPAITLKEARDLRDQAKMAIARTGQPLSNDRTRSFQDVATEWFKKKIEGVRSPGHIETVASRLKRYLFPALGTRPIPEITSIEILQVLRQIEAQGKVETAHRVRQICGQVFRYGVTTGRCTGDPTATLKGALTPKVVVHHASLTNKEDIAGLMRSIDSMNTLQVKNALFFLAYTFVRPGELRKAEWSEINIDKKEWRIPAEKMKMRRLHIVPLSSQALGVLKTLKTISANSRYLFPSTRTKDRPMSENTLLAAIRRLGYTKEEMTPHGFRSMASTVLNEHGWAPDVIERQLAHVEGNSVRAAYNYAEYLPERREMMQWWGSWLEELKRNI